MRLRRVLTATICFLLSAGQVAASEQSYCDMGSMPDVGSMSDVSSNSDLQDPSEAEHSHHPMHTAQTDAQTPSIHQEKPQAMHDHAMMASEMDCCNQVGDCSTSSCIPLLLAVLDDLNMNSIQSALANPESLTQSFSSISPLTLFRPPIIA